MYTEGGGVHLNPLLPYADAILGISLHRNFFLQLLLYIALEGTIFPRFWRLLVATRDDQTLKEVSHDKYSAGSSVM